MVKPKRLNIRVDPAMYRALAGLAKKQEITIQVTVTRALRQYIASLKESVAA